MKETAQQYLNSVRITGSTLLPGFGFCAVIAVAANYMAEHYGSPAILGALLLGMAFNSIAKYSEFAAGLDFCAKTVLRLGVALLGVRLSFSQISALGIEPLMLVVSVVVGTMLFSLAIGKVLRVEVSMAIVSGASVAICGVSAAMAVASVLPQSKNFEQNLLCCLVSVTTLSTLVMVVYPGMALYLGMTPEQIGLFLGSSIHDVAQVFGAGHIISDEVAELATYTKMLRVAMLVPVMLVLVVIFQYRAQSNVESIRRYRWLSVLPMFLVGFIALVVASNFKLLPADWVASMGDVSRICLLLSMAALGTKTNPVELFNVGKKPFLLVAVNTAFIATLSLIFLL